MKPEKKKNIRDSRPGAHTTDTAQRVALRPLLGIPPRVYVSALYGLVFAGILFFIFLYPGLFHPGSQVTFTSLPEEASVLVDGVRIGATPLTAFVPEGRHIITLRRPHFEEKKAPFIAGGRLFGSRFFPLKADFFAELTLSRPRELLRQAHRDFSVWALSGEPGPFYPLPPVLSSAVRDYTAGALTEKAAEELFAMLSSAIASVNSPENFRDFIRAALLAASGGKALSPQALVRAASWFLSLYAKQKDALYWLALVLPEKAREEFLASPWTQEKLQEFAADTDAKVPSGGVSASRTILGARYSVIPAGTFRQGGGNSGGFSRLAAQQAERLGSFEAALRRLRENPPFRAQARTGAFFLRTGEVTQAEYAAFLRENPAWLPSNRAALSRQGLAEESYLASWKDSPEPPRPQDPVSEVSFYAARAYCEWLGGRGSPYVFFLPSEAQWEYAALLGAPGIPATEGLWEWCGSWYAPASYIFPVAADAPVFPAAEKAVRGGAWINSSGALDAATRASQPPEWCSPYLGFRVAAEEVSREAKALRAWQNAEDNPTWKE
jgi:formylglycine-generating enzyme required for sulfatase activity